MKRIIFSLKSVLGVLTTAVTVYTATKIGKQLSTKGLTKAEVEAIKDKLARVSLDNDTLNSKMETLNSEAILSQTKVDKASAGILDIQEETTSLWIIVKELTAEVLKATPTNSNKAMIDAKVQEIVLKNGHIKTKAEALFEDLTKPNFTGDNVLEWFYHNISDFKAYLSTLNIMELSAIFHISSSILIFILLSNIVAVVYGDYIIKYLIRKFNLNTKYPRLIKFIELRQKFRHFYLLINLLLLLITLSTIIYINLLIFSS